MAKRSTVKKIIGRKVANKWLKTKALLKDKLLTKYIPETKKLNKSKLMKMLSKYRMVVLKPNVGSLGLGVIKITKNDGSYAYQYSSRTRTFKTYDNMLNAINKIRKEKVYLIQRGVHLVKIKGRPIDFRIKIEKPNDRWIITEMIGRVAKKGLFVTNIARGGTEIPLDRGIQQALSSSYVKSKRKEMISLTFQCTRVLEKAFPGIRSLGFDYGIDKEGKIWIFEVNTSPM